MYHITTWCSASDESVWVKCSIYCLNAELPNLVLLAFWTNNSFVGVVSTVEILVAFLSSTFTTCQWHLPSCDKKICLLILPNAPWGITSLLVENHYCKVFWVTAQVRKIVENWRFTTVFFITWLLTLEFERIGVKWSFQTPFEHGVSANSTFLWFLG